MNEFKYFFQQGFFHIIDPQALDHVLYFIVLAGAFMIRDWKKILALVTIFTIGHTASLFLVVYKFAAIHPKIVAFLIPLTILSTALYNLYIYRKNYKGDTSTVLYISAIFFGLIHGLGFSGYFKIISSSWSSNIAPVLEFSLGIEISQLLVISVVLGLNYIAQKLFRFSKNEWVLVISSITVGVVMPMVVHSKFW